MTGKVDNSYLTYGGKLPAMELGVSDKYIESLLDTGAVLSNAHNVAFGGGEAEKASAAVAEKTLPALHEVGQSLAPKVQQVGAGQRLNTVSVPTAVHPMEPAAAHLMTQPAEPTDADLGIHSRGGLLTPVLDWLGQVFRWGKGSLARVFGGGQPAGEVAAAPTG